MPRKRTGSGKKGPPAPRPAAGRKTRRLAGALRKAREDVGLSQEALALEAGVGRSGLSHFELGKVEIRTATLFRLIDVLHKADRSITLATIADSAGV